MGLKSKGQLEGFFKTFYEAWAPRLQVIYLEDCTMGGPCWLLKEVPEENRTGRFQGPPCTDNFQIATVKYNGVTYNSCEQAFQSLKFREGTSMQSTIAATRPKHGETGSEHGMRCWQLGQSRSDPLIEKFEDVKVGLMYVVNVAKYVS